MRTEIALGTAQLGMRYGIANSEGVPDREHAMAILRAAKDADVHYLDTAQAYGQSETLLGDILGDEPDGSFKIVTKLKQAENIRSELEQSLRRLQSSGVWGVLLHDEKLLDSWDESVLPQILALKQKKMVECMGVSLYSPEYAEKALLLDSVDIIQVPANLFDRRLLRSNWFARAVASGKKVFVRSVFLQGFIFLSEEVAEKETEHGAEAIRRLTRFCLENQVDKKEFALQFVRHMAPGALLLFGAETAAQVSETVQLIRGEMREAALFDRWMKLWPQDYESLINPLNWTRYQTR